MGESGCYIVGEMNMAEQRTVVTRKGQVTIPAEIRRTLKLKEGDTVAWMIDKDGVRLRRSSGVVARTAGLLKGQEPPLTAEAERAAMEQAVAEESAGRGQD